MLVVGSGAGLRQGRPFYRRRDCHDRRSNKDKKHEPNRKGEYFIVARQAALNRLYSYSLKGKLETGVHGSWHGKRESRRTSISPARALLKAELPGQLRDVVLPVGHLHLLVLREGVPVFRDKRQEKECVRDEWEKSTILSFLLAQETRTPQSSVRALFRAYQVPITISRVTRQTKGTPCQGPHPEQRQQQ